MKQDTMPDQLFQHRKITVDEISVRALILFQIENKNILMSQLENILVRIQQAADTVNLEPWILSKLSGFKKIWGCDIEARMDNGSWQHFSAVRIWHRSPHTDQPHKGGIRYHPLVNVDMMKSHAIEMSIKCWIMNIEWGGAKGGVALDPSKYSAQELKNITESMVDEMDECNILGPFRDVPAPDMGTNPQIMNWIRQRYAQRRRSREDARFAGVVTGKPIGYGFGGIPGRNEATGYGLATLLQYVHDRDASLLVPNAHPTIAVMGFGNVGSHFAKFAHDMGYKIIAVSDVNGGVTNNHGIDISALRTYAEKNKTIIGSVLGEPITNDQLMELPCDILVPAALENVITKDNAHRIKAKIILEGANGPTTPEADDILNARNIMVVPDILANAGGVTVSFFEWARNVNIRDERVPRADKYTVLESMGSMLIKAYQQVRENMLKYKTSLRTAAYITAIERTAPLFRSKHLA